MKWRELQGKLTELDLHDRDIRRKREQVWDEYIAGLPFKVGDKVRVTTGALFNRDVVCFIVRIRPGYTKPEIDFNKMSKDGTMSTEPAGIAYWTAVWVLEPAIQE